VKQTDRAKALEVCLALERAEGMAARGTLTETRARELIGEVLERTSGDTLPFYTAGRVGGADFVELERIKTVGRVLVAGCVANERSRTVGGAGAAGRVE